MTYTKYNEFMAEFFGTMFIILFGDGVNAMTSLFNLGGYTNITFGWGLGVFFGILISNRISGAHLNPAITIALVITKRHPLNKALHYICAQMLGGFVGAGLVYVFYAAKLHLVDPHLIHSAAIFTTSPAITSSFMPGFIAEIMATTILMFTILIISQYFKDEHAPFLTPVTIGALIVGIGMSFGGMHGYAMNPARDFSPRLLIALLGFQNNGLTDGSWIWAAPVFGSLIGAPLGIILFDISFGNKE